jgi:hypothetical protein
MNDNDIFLRGGANRNYGMGFRASVGSQSVDGPFAYGFYGGALGVGNPDTISLRWDWTGNVWVSNLLSTASFEVRSGALVVDAPGSNTNGVLGQGIVFGSSSGEGIVSKRATDGASGWGLDFFTAFQRRLTIQNGGNVGIGTNIPQQKLHVVGNILATGTITPNSDRNAKTDFASVDAAAVLEKVALLPIQQWRFKAEPDGVRHVGPMAQDFRAAFGLGEIPTAIATVDADGVALAAIQGLNEKVEGRMQNAEVRSRRLEEKLEQKETEIAELKTTVNELQQLMQAMNQKLNGGTR